MASCAIAGGNFMIHPHAKWVLIGALGSLYFAGPVSPQTCDSLRGPNNCNIAGGSNRELLADRESDWNFSYAGANRGLGSDLLTGRKDDAAMFGAVVFGGSGTTCMGPFRSRKC